MFNNNLYNMFGNMQNFQQQFNAFSQTFQTSNNGMSPQQMVQNMLNSGQMSQNQFNQLRMMANQITGQNK